MGDKVFYIVGGMKNFEVWEYVMWVCYVMFLNDC